MQVEKHDAAYLWDMWDAAKDIRTFVTSVTFEQYFQNKMLQRAIERLVEIIGEAARNISGEFKQAHPEIPWSEIIGQRNVLAHQYSRIEQDQMFNLATYDIDKLITQLEPLIPPLPPEIED